MKYTPLQIRFMRQKKNKSDLFLVLLSQLLDMIVLTNHV